MGVIGANFQSAAGVFAMSKADAEHFDDYSQQTEVKHKILAGYFKPYLSVLKNQAAWFHYVDGFAGRGEYSGGNIGSPLIALDKLEEAGVLDRATVSLVESRPDHFAELQQNIASSTLVSRLAEPVFVHQGEFGDHLPAILQSPIYERQGSVATFSFVDPCGIKGIAMSDLVELLQQDFGELLLFFNYSGINRILGAMIAGEMKSDVAETFFGSEHVVKGLMATLNSANSSEQKEIEILSVFVNTLRERAGVDYFFPFRFQPRGSDRTSHYIIHYTRHSLGFTIMKHVMWEAAKGDGEEYGRPELTA